MQCNKYTIHGHTLHSSMCSLNALPPCLCSWSALRCIDTTHSLDGCRNVANVYSLWSVFVRVVLQMHHMLVFVTSVCTASARNLDEGIGIVWPRLFNEIYCSCTSIELLSDEQIRSLVVRRTDAERDIESERRVRFCRVGKCPSQVLSS